jgi:hypothetical protein
LDPVTLAAAAIAAAIPYVVALGKEAAKSAAGEAGKSVWQWVKGKLTSAAGKEAVNDLENAPDDADNRKAAEAALSKLLKTDPGALSELAQLLEKAGVTSTVQTANVVGDDNIVGQVSGSGNTVSINRGATPPVKPSKAS